jgi:3-dehydroquinate synthase
LKAAKVSAELIVIPDGEKYKTLKSYDQIISRMIDLKIDRYSALLTFGGGVIGDLGGFVAAGYMRGIDLIHIPTTLLAQIDSSIGGKTAVDHPHGKNLIGAFYFPRMVITDPNLLTTLNDKEFSNGLFEAIKVSLIANRKLYNFIRDNLDQIKKRRKKALEYLVSGCVGEKIRIVNKDPYDNGIRMILNFGHTFGHALEVSGQYRRISHGEAVGWGMLVAMKLSAALTGFDLAGNNDIYDMIKNLLPKRNFGSLGQEKLWQTISLDKKVKNRKVRFVLLKKTGQPVIREVDKKAFLKAAENL